MARINYQEDVRYILEQDCKRWWSPEDVSKELERLLEDRKKAEPWYRRVFTRKVNRLQSYQALWILRRMGLARYRYTSLDPDTVHPDERKVNEWFQLMQHSGLYVIGGSEHRRRVFASLRPPRAA